MPTRILSSPWCRCKETAHLVGLGGLANSILALVLFYQNHADKTEVLAALKVELDNLGDGGTLLLVTHQVVIQAVTGQYMPSGGYIIMNSQDIIWQ